MELTYSLSSSIDAGSRCSKDYVKYRELSVDTLVDLAIRFSGVDFLREGGILSQGGLNEDFDL